MLSVYVKILLSVGKMKSAALTKKIMEDALLRSGYLLESRVISKLVKKGYFVEPNQHISDAVTGKSREIDLIAERYDSGNFERPVFTNTYVAVKFVCEIKNTPYPTVLLTELPFSPGLNPWESLHEGVSGLFKEVDVEPSFYDLITHEQKIFTQYCSFKLKKTGLPSEWMAWHPDDFYDDLLKLISYSRQEVKQASILNDAYDRLILFLPVVILAGDLYTSKPQEETVNLTKVDWALYMQFEMYDKKQESSLIVFVTERHFINLFEKIISSGEQLESAAIEKWDPNRKLVSASKNKS